MVTIAFISVSWIIRIVLIAALVVVIYKIFGGRKKGAGAAAAENPDRILNATIKDARVGDIVSITGFGDEFDDVDFTIEKRNRYDAHGWEWFELLGVYKGRQIWIEWEEDDALRITATSPERQIRLSQLDLTEDDLARMDDEESHDNYIEWQAQKYYYRESDEVMFHKDCVGEGEGFYLWDFEAEDGMNVISAEKWEGEPFQIFSGVVVQPYNIKVFKK